TALRFSELAAVAGRVLATMPAEARQVLPKRFPVSRYAADDCAWVQALWCLAWEPRPGSLLQADKSPTHRDPERMFYSAIVIDPFAASVELIDILLDQQIAADGAAVQDTGNPIVQAVVTILRKLRGRGLPYKKILTELKKKKIDIKETTFRKHYVPKLKE